MTDIVKMIAMKKGLRKSENEYDRYGIVFYNPKYRSYEECHNAWDAPVTDAHELYFISIDNDGNMHRDLSCRIDAPDEKSAMSEFRNAVSNGMRLTCDGTVSRTFVLLGQKYNHYFVIAESDNDGNIREY